MSFVQYYSADIALNGKSICMVLNTNSDLLKGRQVQILYISKYLQFRDKYDNYLSLHSNYKVTKVRGSVIHIILGKIY